MKFQTILVLDLDLKQYAHEKHKIVQTYSCDRCMYIYLFQVKIEYIYWKSLSNILVLLF